MKGLKVEFCRPNTSKTIPVLDAARCEVTGLTRLLEVDLLLLLGLDVDRWKSGFRSTAKAEKLSLTCQRFFRWLIQSLQLFDWGTLVSLRCQFDTPGSDIVRGQEKLRALLAVAFLTSGPDDLRFSSLGVVFNV
jgi:hypothetical protein